MEYIERTETAGNAINSNTNQQEKNMTEQTEQNTESNISTIPISIPVNELLHKMIKDGNLINIITQDSEFDNAVESVLSDKADDAISEYISGNASDIANQLDDSIREIVNDSLDYSDIASNLEYELDWSSKVQSEVESMMDSFSVGTDCSTAKMAASIIIDTIRYDLVSHLREEQGATSVYKETITNALTKFIDERIEVRLNQEKEQYLKNKQEYMQETADKLNEPTITVEQFKKFINGLDLFQETKNRILSEFDKTTVQFNNNK